MRNYEELYHIWEKVNHIGGWLRILERYGGFSPEEIEILERIDEEAIAVEKEAEEYYYQVELPRVRKEIEEFKAEIEREYGREWVRERRLEYLERRLKEVKKRIEQNYIDFFDGLKRDIPFWLRQAVLEINRTQELEEERERLEKEIYFLKFNSEIKKKGISELEIERALNFPFKNLIQANQMEMAICPFHPDKRPSFWIKNNWGYCFGCKWHGNTIKFLMDRNKMSFPEAVKALQ
jgi:hypothetical protein